MQFLFQFWLYAYEFHIQLNLIFSLRLEVKMMSALDRMGSLSSDVSS